MGSTIAQSRVSARSGATGPNRHPENWTEDQFLLALNIWILSYTHLAAQAHFAHLAGAGGGSQGNSSPFVVEIARCA